jgi:dihydroorotate dehydrogenase (fumarate)
MDLTTKYLGFELAHPFMVGASPMCDDMDTIRRLEDAGASAIVMHSLFEEEVVGEEMATTAAMEDPANSFAEALSYFPAPDNFVFGSTEYLNQVRRVKAAVKVPVIASLNSFTEGRWADYAVEIESAGADALELNVYFMAADSSITGASIETRTLDLLKRVKAAVKIPVAVKLSPYYTSFANFACQLDEAGADGLVLFNRFYQPDVDVHNLEVNPELKLSDPSELQARLRWLAILSPKFKASLAVTGGVHSALGAIKALMTGAHGVQLVSTLYKNGPSHLTTIRNEVAQWLQARGYESLAQLQGSMNLDNAPNPDAYVKANYLQMLKIWKGKF